MKRKVKIFSDSDTDKDKALKHVEALKKLSMAVDATVWMEEIDD